MSQARFKPQQRQRIHLAAAIGAALALLIGLALASPVTSEPSRQKKTSAKKKASPTSDAKVKRAPRRFKHDEGGHKGMKCIKCHLKGSKDAIKTRPGRKNHSPCDTCHVSEFYKPIGAIDKDDQDDFTKKRNRLCQVCHLEEAPSNWKPMPGDALQEYPSQVHSLRAFRVEFSHAKHVGYDSKNGGDLSCKTCHLGGPRSKGEGAKPSHANCNKCHNTDDGQKPTLSQCNKCHIKNEGDAVRLPYGEINDRVVKARKACRVGVVEMEYEVNSKKTRKGAFSHENHLAFKNYDKLSCASCHDNVRNADTLNEIILFGDAKGVDVKYKVCGNKKCHAGKAAFSVKSNAACSSCHYKSGCKTPAGARPDLTSKYAQ